MRQQILGKLLETVCREYWSLRRARECGRQETERYTEKLETCRVAKRELFLGLAVLWDCTTDVAEARLPYALFGGESPDWCMVGSPKFQELIRNEGGQLYIGDSVEVRGVEFPETLP